MPLIESERTVYVVEHTWPDGSQVTVAAFEDLTDAWVSIRRHLESETNLQMMEWRKHAAYRITIVPMKGDS